MSYLKNTLIDISRGITPDTWLPYSLRERDATDAFWDYRIEKHATRLDAMVIFPDSKPALEWLQDKLPENTARYGKLRPGTKTWSHGFIVDNSDESDLIAHGMFRDGLMSFDEYEAAEEEMQLQFAQAAEEF